MKKYVTFLFLSSLILISCRIDDSPINDSYPTTISRLSDTKLNEAIIEYENLNDFYICTQLNEYGFPEYGLSHCLGRPILREEINKDESELLNMAKAVILKNKKFTGVADVSRLSIRRSTGSKGCIKCDDSDGDIKNIKWIFDFNNQLYEGLEVFNTQIRAVLDNNGVFMLSGNWYPHIAVPKTNLYSLEQIKEDLVGQKRTIYCWTNYGIAVTEDNFPSEAGEVIIPIEKEYEIELRVAWEIIISGAYYVFYVDVVSGEIIMEHQLIIC